MKKRARSLNCQSGPALRQLPGKGVQICIRSLGVCDYNDIETRRDVCHLMTDGFAKPSFDSISNHGIPNLATDSEPHSRLLELALCVENQHTLKANPSTRALNTLDVD